MFGLGMPELLIILVIILIIFGASRLPEIGKGLGKGIRNFRESTSEKPKEISPDSAESKAENEKTDDQAP
jgi:sec-independent protein translocase protein TatA